MTEKSPALRKLMCRARHEDLRIPDLQRRVAAALSHSTGAPDFAAQTGYPPAQFVALRSSRSEKVLDLAQLDV